MNIQMLLIVVVVFFVLGSWWSNFNLRDKILVYYNRPNKTQIYKFVKGTDRHVVFDNKRFDIITGRVVYREYASGFNMLFPRSVPVLFFSHNSRFPHDPNNLDVNTETPEIRNALNLQEWVLSYFRGAKPSQSKPPKFGFLQQWLPVIIAVAAVGLLYFYFNSKMEGFGNILDQVITKVNGMK